MPRTSYSKSVRQTIQTGPTHLCFTTCEYSALIVRCVHLASLRMGWDWSFGHMPYGLFLTLHPPHNTAHSQIRRRVESSPSDVSSTIPTIGHSHPLARAANGSACTPPSNIAFSTRSDEASPPVCLFSYQLSFTTLSLLC